MIVLRSKNDERQRRNTNVSEVTRTISEDTRTINEGTRTISDETRTPNGSHNDR